MAFPYWKSTKPFFFIPFIDPIIWFLLIIFIRPFYQIRCFQFRWIKEIGFKRISTFDLTPDEFQKLLEKRDAEYIDLMNYGIRSEVLNHIGFLKKDENIIIPNNFEPFERKNVTIRLAFKTDKENFTVFKGDSDQDRPNAGFYNPKN